MIEIVYALVVTHITIVCVTLYLHRGVTHQALTFNPLMEHFMRFWLWLTTGMVTKEWVAIHRKHHAFTEMPKDPHSPANHGILRVLFGGVAYYKRAAKDPKTMEYGWRVKDDWIERNLYTPYSWVGIFLLLPLLNVLTFGMTGIIIWLVQLIWIPFFAAGVINGLGHFFGYRSHDTRDRSTNIVPFGILVGGEELHNNHHKYPMRAKLSDKWFEFDIGWMWIQIFSRLNLVKVK